MLRPGLDSQRKSPSAGPTLQHPKPVPIPFALPASPPIPDAQAFAPSGSQIDQLHNPYHNHLPPSAASETAPDYQRFSSPPGPSHIDPHQAFYQPSASSQIHDPINPYNHFQPRPQMLWNGLDTSAGVPNSFQAPGLAGVNDLTAQMGLQFGQSAMRAGSEYVEKNLIRYLPLSHLKHSFNVSNLYVFNKIKLVLFPWRHKPWSRLVKRSDISGQVEGYMPPREDINCPDAYIPVMALMTYILLSGAVAGAKGKFDPELLSIVASQALGIIFLEFCCIKLGCYLLNVNGDGAVIDLVAYSGYKFVGIIVNVLALLVGFRSSIRWAIFIYVFASNAFFLLRSLRYVILPDPTGQQSFGSNYSSTSTVNSNQKAKRIQFLFAISVSQFASMWLLSRG